MGKSSQKKTVNAYMDREIADIMATKYEGITSRIMNNLCRKFIEQVATEPTLLAHVLDENIIIVVPPKKPSGVA